MSLFREKEDIKAQIVDTERILELIGDHPIMSTSYRERLNNLRSKLEVLPEHVLEAKVRLLFSGSAVKGSQGIKSTFISRAIIPFTSLVKTQAALSRFGKTNGKGHKKYEPNTDLFITALPVGSFGIELSQLKTNDLYDEGDVTKAIRQTMQLIYAASESDEQFEQSVETAPKKTLKNLRAFLKEVANENSIIKMESGELGFQISEDQVWAAYQRVDAAGTEEDEIFIMGILRGILLESGRFEVTDLEGKLITGTVGRQLQEDEIISYSKSLLNKPCQVHLQVNTTTYKTGSERITYELLGIQPV